MTLAQVYNKLWSTLNRLGRGYLTNEETLRHIQELAGRGLEIIEDAKPKRRRR